MIRVKLRDYLDSEGITTYQLAHHVVGINPKTVYTYTNGTRNPTLESLDKLITALRHLTGKKVGVEDLIEVVEDSPRLTAAGLPYSGDPDTDDVLDSFPDILERIERLEKGEAKLIPWEHVKEELGL